ncbi:alpha/beta hydrolase fold domain-containing protein [uncultured Mediterranea sp.]|uniref:alpha/beta hydrolase n=1 Tax=uncultured Mediterranea sp. TaxID=1926662 RepID=UPI0027D93915|nr:alpha/beta hydrolase fold domain-containing protein [uncultured Mediterranea sp.]
MKTIIFSVLLSVATMLSAQNTMELPLWPAGAPNSNGLSGAEEMLDGGRVSHVSTPSVTVYKAEKPNGMAIIMCPGGGYALLAMNHEGHDMAPWLNAQGITYIVLKYRMPNGHYEVPLSDAEQAIRLVRRHAKEWNIRPDRIGIMGASAGGHLAASLATLYSSEETRPDFQILLYPVISMQTGVTHGGSRQNLLGKEPSQELTEKFTLEKQVNERTPQAFLVLSADDRSVPPANGIHYFEALLQHQVPATLHVYPTGGHGWGFRDAFPYKRQWTGELEKWLREGLKFD